jgi:hypothetical protein
MTSPTVSRYAAKLLFQFRVMVGQDAGVRRLCEERLIVLRAKSAKEAIKTAKKRAKAAEHHYKNSEGNHVYFEWVGIRDMIGLGSECDDDEVWYDIGEKIRPMERAATLTLSDADLQRILGPSRTEPTTMVNAAKRRRSS